MPILPIFLPTFWEPLLLFPLLVLIIPIAILIGQRWRSGPLVSLSAGAILGMVIYLALLALTWSSFSANFNQSFGGYYTEAVLSLVGGAVLLLGASALAFADVLRGRRRVWLAPLCLFAYATFVGTLGFVTTPLRFCGDALGGPNGGPSCAPPDFSLFAIFGALSLAGPIATLLYALLAHGRAAPAPARESEQPVGAGG